MALPKIYSHCSYIGDTGYNNHSRDFFRHLSKYCEIKIRNFTVGKSWKSFNSEPHNDETYFTEIDKKLLYEQILWNTDGSRGNFKIYEDPKKEWKHDLNIVLCETDHYIFYDSYLGPKIAYNVWETTLQPENYFKKLLEFDEMWVPSKWQRDCMVKQGYPSNKIKVVPEGVDDEIFFPDPQASHEVTSDGRFKFFLAGRWDYRKSTKEIIETFIKTFDKSEKVDLIVSIDNPFSNDGLTSTEERLDFYGLRDDRIKILHFPSRSEYISILKSCNVFVSCARSEGWNLPLIESMACGTPSIYSNCSGQLEFADGKGIAVRVLGEKPANESSYNHFNEMVGNYYEPDFNDLSEKMRFSFEFYDQIKKKSIDESIDIRKKFNWDSVARLSSDMIEDFMIRKTEENKTKNNNVIISYLEGPKVEILGEKHEEYLIEFIDKITMEVVHSDNITTNMWTQCSRKYFTEWIIKINGKIYNEFNLENKNVLISLESKSIGDTIAWAPYAIDFSKKHNCTVYLSTFHNEWFSKLDEYKDIKFIKPGSSVDCFVVYRIGWFKDSNNSWKSFDRYPNQVNLIPLQKTASDILGLPYYELNYGLDLKIGLKPNKKDYIVFGPNSTAGCKEWPKEYWSSLAKMIKELGFDVFTLTQNPYQIEGTKNINGKNFNEVATYLFHAKAFIGLGSGLSWLNWSMGKHTFMINGFTKDGHEFSSNLTKIYNRDTCIYCWNDEIFTFDPGDWDWCPVYKGTSKQHICQKSIKPDQVYDQLKTFL